MSRRKNGDVVSPQLEGTPAPLVVPDITEDMLLEKTRLALYRVMEKVCENPQTMGAIAADVGKIVFDRANQIGAGGVPYESRVRR